MAFDANINSDYGREAHLTSRICQDRREDAVNVNDYLIDQAGFDWQAMLAGWADILPETFTMWLVNRFGDAFIIRAGWLGSPPRHCRRHLVVRCRAGWKGST
jgi:hypothetical protein